jgi:hypothetical protein
LKNAIGIVMVLWMKTVTKLGLPACALCGWLGFEIDAFTQLVTTGQDDLYSITEGSVDNPDVVWSKRIPVINDEITISARVRGTGAHPVPVQFVLEAPRALKTVLTARPGPAPGRMPTRRM